MEGARLIDESRDPGAVERQGVQTIPPLPEPSDDVI